MPKKRYNGSSVAAASDRGWHILREVDFDYLPGGWDTRPKLLPLTEGVRAREVDQARWMKDAVL